MGVVVVYALGRWFFAWRQARRDGQIHPLRAVLAEDDDSETMRRTPCGGFSSYRQFFGFVGSAAAVALIASLTHDRLRVSLMWTIVPLLTLALAYLDFRLSRKARDRRGERRKAPHRDPYIYLQIMMRGFPQKLFGGVLLSHRVPPAVPSALKGLASG
ncbi:hypothetical protein ACFC0S_33480, partial [Streptomyces sp. NPDC056084]|uniref:hypothetical protein n=1 Tax=Streptomyces sp. NPDC056084 TaxID=3345707 RepID=UPI0035E15739